MPNLEVLISKNSAEITKNYVERWMSKILYAYRQAKLSKQGAKHCVFSIFVGGFIGHYLFKKDSSGVSDIPTVFQEHTDKVLEFKTPVKTPTTSYV